MTMHIAINNFCVTVGTVISGEVVDDFNLAPEGFRAFVVIVVTIVVIIRALLVKTILVVGLQNHTFHRRPAGDIL